MIVLVTGCVGFVEGGRASVNYPRTVDLKDEDLKKLIVEMLGEKLKEDKVDINLYRLYFALEYLGIEFKEFDLEKEIKILEDRRKKEAQTILGVIIKMGSKRGEALFW